MKKQCINKALKGKQVALRIEKKIWASLQDNGY